MKDVITSSTESALAVQVGDLEIASDQLKMSAWLATIATAGLYFCLNDNNEHIIYLADSLRHPQFYPYIAISFIFGLSLIVAYKFHIVHNHFCALSRNAICGYKIQHSAVLQAMENPAFAKALKKEQNPIWALTSTGELSKLTNPELENIIDGVLNKIEIYRKRVDIFLSLQRALTLASFLLLIIANAYFSVSI